MSDSGSHKTSLHSFNISGDNPSNPGALLSLSSLNLFLTRYLVIVALEYVVWIRWWLADIFSHKHPTEGFIQCLGSFSVILCNFSGGSLESGDGSLSSSLGADVCPKVFMVVQSQVLLVFRNCSLLI